MPLNIPTSWHGAYSLARSARDPYGNGKPVGNNTRLIIQADDEVGLLYHKTFIVTYHTNGGMTLNSGGWRTVTTKERISQALPMGWAIRSEQGQWFVVNVTSGVEYIYYDGFEFQPDGFDQLQPAPDPAKAKAELATWEYNKVVRQQIRRFVRNLTAEQVSNALEGHGSCEQCLIRPGLSHPDHLVVHVQENFLTKELVYASLAARGFVDPYLILNVVKVAAVVQDEVDSMLKQALRKYLDRQIMGV